MIRASLVIVTAVALSQTAAAQNCPPGAATQASIPDGTSFRVVSLHPDDAYYEGSYADIVGIDATSTAELTNNGDCWFGGPANASNGDSYYFYKAAVVLDAPAGGKTALPTAATDACPAGAIRSTPVVGNRYTVLGLHSQDAYSSGTTVSQGDVVIFDENPTIQQDCWMSGSARTASGTDLYFFKVAVSGDAAAPTDNGRVLASCPASASRGPIASGTRVRFLGIHADDAYANGAGTFGIGDIMTTTGEMNINDACWYGGPTEARDGSTQYFYKAAFELVAGGSTDDRGSDKTPTVGGQSITDQLRSLSPNDALDENARAILVSSFDRNGSDSIDTMNEVNRIPCDVLTALDVPYQARWGTSVRVSLGFKANLLWVGHSIGFSETMRSIADRQFARCGVE